MSRDIDFFQIVDGCVAQIDFLRATPPVLREERIEDSAGIYGRMPSAKATI